MSIPPPNNSPQPGSDPQNPAPQTPQASVPPVPPVPPTAAGAPAAQGGYGYDPNAQASYPQQAQQPYGQDPNAPFVPPAYQQQPGQPYGQDAYAAGPGGYAQATGGYAPYSQYPQEPAKKKPIWPWIAGGSGLLAIVLVLVLVLVFSLNGKNTPDAPVTAAADTTSASAETSGASASASSSSSASSSASASASSSSSSSSAAPQASGDKLPRYAPDGAKNDDKVKVKATAKVTGKAKIRYGTSGSTSSEEITSSEFVKESEITRKDGYEVDVNADYNDESAEISCVLSVNDQVVSRYSAKGSSSSVQCSMSLEQKMPELYNRDYMRKGSDYEGEEVTVEAKVTSNGNVRISYGPNYATSRIKNKGDWSTSVKQERREDYNLYVSSDYTDGASELSCTILVDGKEVAKNTATGKNSNVTCSIPYDARHKSS